MIRTVLAVAIVAAALAAGPPARAGAGHFDETVLWDADTDQTYENFHVHALGITRTGTVLAFTEGRYEVCDAGPRDVLLRRSTDGGATWQPTQVVVPSQDGSSPGNPAMVADRATGEVFLFYNVGTRDAGNTTCSADRTRLFVISSRDDGLTWSQPRELTSLFDGNPNGWTLHNAGPGNGLQLANGRLYMPANHRREISYSVPERRYGMSGLYSDDHGATWQAATPVPVSASYPMNEVRVYQRSDGALVANTRNAVGGGQRRIVAISQDGGTTWSEPKLDTAIDSYVAVDSAVRRYSGGPGGNGPDRLLFSRPDSTARENMTVSISYDEGYSYRYSKVVNAGPSYYSDLAVAADGTILMLYGKDGANASFPARVALARFDLAWLTDGRDSAGEGPGLTEQAIELAGVRHGTGRAVSDPLARGGEYLTFQAAQAGDRVEVPFVVKGRSRTPAEVAIRYLRVPDGATVRVAIDDIPLPAAEVDTSSASLPMFQVYRQGSLTLQPGKHAMTFTVTGPGHGGGMTLALDHLSLVTGGFPADPPKGITDNDTALNFAIASGTWATGTGATGYYGRNYRSHAAGDGSSVARWSPEVPASGVYEVAVRYTADPNRASNAPYTVTYAGGSATVRVNQRANGGIWVPIGRYPFVAGNAGTVELSDGANGYVIADAIRLTPVTGR
ncbi:exo-alpha-sialidase [Nonomuraea sp. NPDC005983]|uniref:golvesin C-terminal-like domain-containing protein n=1 Tax=Nonomuraea sp. NPDC005983 TaxID=3155595 RepID=UPI0033B713E7